MRIKEGESEISLVEATPLPTNMALEILLKYASGEGEEPNEASALLIEYEHAVELDKIIHFFMTSDGGIGIETKFKKPIGFNHD